MEILNASTRLMTVFFSRRTLAFRSSALSVCPGTSGMTSVKLGSDGRVPSLMGAHTWHVEPHDASKSPAAKDNRRPESTTLVVPFETGGGTVRDDETEHGTQSKWRCLIRRSAG
jgi:hypothetical protein